MHQRIGQSIKPTIRRRFFRMITWLTVCPIILMALGFFSYLIITGWQRSLGSADAMSRQISISIEELIQPYDRMLVSYFENARVQQILKTVDAAYTEEQKSDRNEVMVSFCRTLCYANEDIFNLEYVLDNGERFAAFNDFYSVDRQAIETAVSALRQSDPFGMALLLPRYRYLQSGTAHNVISLVRLIYHEDYQPVGYGVVLIKLSVFNNVLKNLTDVSAADNDGADVLILSGRDLFFSSDAALQPEAEELMLLQKINKQEKTIRLQGELYEARLTVSDYTGLTTVVCLPVRILFAGFVPLLLGLAVVVLFSIGILVLANHMYDRTVALPILVLSQEMTSPSRQQQDEKNPIVFAEIETLYQSYHQMLRQNQEMLAKEKEYQENVSALEQLTLSMEINPHYFGNVLSMISARAYDEGMADIVRICENMALTFRYAMKKPLMVTLDEELEMISHYILILQDLYEREIRLQIEVPSELMKVSLPKVTLQPLIENSVMHSILYKEQAGTIRITACREGERMLVSVWDDGAGFDAAQLIAVQASLRESMEDFIKGEKHSIGLKTVHYRVRQYFGEAYGVEIDSLPNDYTKVTIVLPLEKEE